MLRTGPVKVLLLLVDQVPTILALVIWPTAIETRQAVMAYAEDNLIFAATAVCVCVLFLSLYSCFDQRMRSS